MLAHIMYRAPRKTKGQRRAQREKRILRAFMQPLSLKLDDGPGAKRECASGTLIFASERASSLALSRVCGGPSVCSALVCLLLSGVAEYSLFGSQWLIRHTTGPISALILQLLFWCLELVNVKIVRLWLSGGVACGCKLFQSLLCWLAVSVLQVVFIDRPSCARDFTNKWSVTKSTWKIAFFLKLFLPNLAVKVLKCSVKFQISQVFNNNFQTALIVK